MATTYTATVNIQCLKEHTCVGCEGKYSYLLTREIKGQGGTQQVALTNAQNKAVQSMENDVDFHPCPACGIVQPEMVADVKSGYAWTALVLGLIIIAVALICGLAQGMRIMTSAYVAVAGAILSTLIFAIGAIYNPNKNLQANIAKSQQKIAEKQIVVTEEASPTNVVDRYSGILMSNIVGMVFAAATILVLAAPVLLTAVNGWNLNESTYPAVAGPGDTTTFYFNESLKSLKGKWYGNVGVMVNNPEIGIGANALTGKTKSESWGNQIDDESSTNTMWAQVDFPSNLEDVVGKTADLSFVVRVTFPTAVGAGFANQNRAFKHNAKVTLSGAGSGALFYSSWLYGQLAGLVMLMIATGAHVSAAGWLRKQGNPTEVTTLGEVVEGMDEEGAAEGEIAEPNQEPGLASQPIDTTEDNGENPYR